MNVRPPKPREFFGRPALDKAQAREWAGSTKKYLNLVGMIPTDQVNFAVALLKGDAYIWWTHLEMSGQHMPLLGSWELFSAAFICAFEPTEETAGIKLGRLKQTGGVQVYAST